MPTNKYPVRSVLTGRRYRLAHVDGQPILQAPYVGSRRLELRLDTEGGVEERVINKQVTRDWRPVSWHPDVVAELQALLIDAMAAEA